MTTVSGATGPSSSRSQVSIDGVSRATTSARGANASSGSIPLVRCEDDRCSWWTTTTRSGSSCTALASSAGVTVTTTSVARLLSAASSATSVRAENWPSQRRGTSTDSASRRGSRSVPGRTSTRCWTVTRPSMSKAGSSAERSTLRMVTSWLPLSKPASALACVIAARSVPPIA